MNNVTDRCPWCGTEEYYVEYHDTEWGVPVTDSRALFEKLILDGFQAGLSWSTILKKRIGFIEAFDGFQPDVMANYDDARLEQLMQDSRIVRNRAKIRAARLNAQAYLAMADQNRDFASFCWSFVGDSPKVNRWQDMSQVPTQTDQSVALSKALLARGFKFVGPTIIYAFMQAVGMVNDHLVTCFRHHQCIEQAKVEFSMNLG